MKKRYLLLLLFLSPTLAIFAQSSKQKKADRLYEDFAFVKAIDVYQDLLERNYNLEYNKRRLADSYYLLRDPENAVRYYEEVVQQPEISPEYYYKYAQVLRGVRRYEESREWLGKYQEKGKDSDRFENFLEVDGIKTYDALESFRLQASAFNSEFSDFGAYDHNGTIYFTSARGEGLTKTKIYDWNGEPFLDVYQTSSSGSSVTAVKGDINTVRHEGPVSISEDGKTIYFTRNNYMNNKNGKRDKEGVNHLKIYKATLEGDAWTNVEELPFNDNSYSVGHPSLSPDGKTLYFASDAPQGFGGTDLYKVSIEDSTYGTPENLGSEINTPGNESFPFITEENILYFSSDGHKGYGFLDVFMVALEEKENVLNLGEPINSSLDDFAFFISENNKEGFVSSNRSGGMGSDDIYKLMILEPLILKGTVIDSINSRPIPNSTVRLLDENNNQIAFLETDSLGRYETRISRDKIYPIEAKHIKYDSKKGTLSTFEMDTKSELIYDIELSPVNDVEYLAEINKIYFDFDKYNIRPDAAEELDKLVDLMIRDYPELVLEIGSHTDTRGSQSYNDGLAKRRAHSTYEYLVSKGIPKERIVTYKGYGEQRPEIDCTNCNEQQHQLNRRSVFKVVKME